VPEPDESLEGKPGWTRIFPTAPANQNPNLLPPDQVELCPKCHGAGSVPLENTFFMGAPPTQLCPRCNGFGRVPKERIEPLT
jgi:hypothetical protein